MEYIFAGAGGNLVEKNYYEDSALNWGISYYEYQEQDGRIYPRGIILKNYKYSYSLTVRLKEVRT
jgi:outer membrane biogenesis lipoprotein LolB